MATFQSTFQKSAAPLAAAPGGSTSAAARPAPGRGADRRLVRLVELSGAGLLACSGEGLILRCSPLAASLLGERPAAVTGQPLERWWPAATAARCREWLRPGLTTQSLVGPGGVARALELTIGEAPDSPAGHWLIMLREAPDHQASQQRLSRLANYDSLTGLPNRELFRQRLGRAMERTRSGKRVMALMFLDLDDFKRVNDSLGHEAGDNLLRHVAITLKGCVWAGQTPPADAEGDGRLVARLGGDEFTIVVQDAGGADDMAVMARRVLDALDTPFRVGQAELHLAASIGISMHAGSSDVDLDGLIRQTDMAMYRAKFLGRGTYSFYSAELGARAAARVALESELRQGLDRGEFVLHYQPKVELLSGRVTGVEALLRWHCPGRGMVAPARFISVLEDSGLVLPVGAWAIRQACADLAEWDRQGLPPLRMAVNLSARQFRHGTLVRLIADALADAGLEPGRLEVELTESMLLEDTDATRQILSTLAGMGVRLALDDFGTGHSSLSYLKRFDIHTLKIDKSFVSELPHNPEDAAIAAAIVAMGQTLQMRIVAEGVEDREQAEHLKDLGCDEIQGYWLSRPLAAEALGSWLQARQRQESDRRFGRRYTDTGPTTVFTLLS